MRRASPLIMLAVLLLAAAIAAAPATAAVHGHGGGGHSHGGGGHGHGGGHWHGGGGHWHGGIWIGGPWWWGYPYYPYYPYGYTYPNVVVVEPDVYTQQQAQPANDWYYCATSQSYYPYVQTCETPWIRVPPRLP